jgi:hypothetical protein
MHKNATKCNETLSKWCKNKHGASKIMDTLETYQCLYICRKPLSYSIFKTQVPKLCSTGMKDWSCSSARMTVPWRTSSTYSRISVLLNRIKFVYPLKILDVKCFERSSSPRGLFDSSSNFSVAPCAERPVTSMREQNMRQQEDRRWQFPSPSLA